MSEQKQRYKIYEQALREILRRSGMTPQDEVSAERMLDSLLEVLRSELSRKSAKRGKRKAKR